MGTRYLLSVECPKCKIIDDDVYYAPTCGFLTFKCKCGYEIDLEKYTGISYENASNASEIAEIIKNKGG